MLKPSKHLDLDRSVIRVASIALDALRKRRILSHNRVVKLIRDRVGDDGDVVVAPALSFLFLLGRVEYHVINDSFEYLEPSQVHHAD